MTLPPKYSEYDGRPELKKQAMRFVILRNVLIFFVVVYMMLTATIQTIGAFQSYKGRAAVLDCTQPTGDCFKDGQKRTGSAVNGIVSGTRATIIATEWCNARQEFESINELEKCVDDRLKELAK